MSVIFSATIVEISSCLICKFKKTHYILEKNYFLHHLKSTIIHFLKMGKIPTVEEMPELCRELLEKCAELDRKFADDNPFI